MRAGELVDEVRADLIRRLADGEQVRKTARWS
jgi:hypothetical protein